MKKITLVVISLLAIFFLYFFVFIIWTPFGAEITQDRPFIRFLCKMQAACHVGVGKYSCSEDFSTPLLRWNGFKGCNNMTRGYDISDNRILVESCNCGGLM